MSQHARCDGPTFALLGRLSDRFLHFRKRLLLPVGAARGRRLRLSVTTFCGAKKKKKNSSASFKSGQKRISTVPQQDVEHKSQLFSDLYSDPHQVKVPTRKSPARPNFRCCRGPLVSTLMTGVPIYAGRMDPRFRLQIVVENQREPNFIFFVAGSFSHLTDERETRTCAATVNAYLEHRRTRKFLVFCTRRQRALLFSRCRFRFRPPSCVWPRLGETAADWWRLMSWWREG